MAKKKEIKDRQIQVVNINLLRPYTNNPRNNQKSIKYLEKTIQEYGFTTPITTDENFVIVTGHSRYFAAKNIGLSEVPIIVLDDLSDAEIKQYRIADNKVQEHTSFNFEGFEDMMRNLTKEDDLFGDVFSEFVVQEPEEVYEEEKEDFEPEEDYDEEDEEDYDEDEEDEDEEDEEEEKDCICPYCLHTFDLHEAEGIEPDEDDNEEPEEVDLPV